jgi:UDP-N-acetyl-D-mannosaminuronic acid dehydrogenase
MVPSGTTDTVIGGKLKKNGYVIGKDIFLVFALERVMPGNLMKELTKNDRIIGGTTGESALRALDFYKTFVTGNIHLCDSRTAEIVKLFEITYRDVNIALANEFALLAEKAGINVYKAIELANNHPRVNILKPGPGVGGHCIAEDPYFFN